MSVVTRTDMHRPSAESFDPQDYEVKGVAYLGKVEAPEETKAARRALDEGFSFAPHQKVRRCGHCGARIAYAGYCFTAPPGS